MPLNEMVCQQVADYLNGSHYDEDEKCDSTWRHLIIKHTSQTYSKCKLGQRIQWFQTSVVLSIKREYDHQYTVVETKSSPPVTQAASLYYFVIVVDIIVNFELFLLLFFFLLDYSFAFILFNIFIYVFYFFRRWRLNLKLRIIFLVFRASYFNIIFF